MEPSRLESMVVWNYLINYPHTAERDRKVIASAEIWDRRIRDLILDILDGEP